MLTYAALSQALAKKHAHTKFARIFYKNAIPNYPIENLPTILGAPPPRKKQRAQPGHEKLRNSVRLDLSLEFKVNCLPALQDP